MLSELKGFFPSFLNRGIENVLERCATLQAFGLDPDRTDPPTGETKEPTDSPDSSTPTHPLDLPSGGVGYHFQRTGIDAMISCDRSNPAKSALWRAQQAYEKVNRARYATRDGFEKLEKAQEELDKAVERYQPIVDEYDIMREAHARAVGEMYRGLSLAMWAVGKREGKQGETYQGFLRDLIFIRQPYAEEARIKEQLDLYIYEMDLGDGRGPQPPQGMEPVFSSSLATSYLSDSTAFVELPSYVRAQEEVMIEGEKEKEEDRRLKQGSGDDSNPTIKADVVESPVAAAAAAAIAALGGADGGLDAAVAALRLAAEGFKAGKKEEVAVAEDKEDHKEVEIKDREGEAKKEVVAEEGA